MPSAIVGRVDAVGGDQRDADVVLELLRHPGKAGARHAGGDGGDARLVPADAAVDQRGAGGLDRLRELHHLLEARAVLDQVEHRQPEDDDELAPQAFARAAHDLGGEADAVLVRAAPFVAALVGVGDDELVDQVALGTHDLDAVVAASAGELGAAHEVLDRALDVGGGQLARREGRDRRLDRAGRDQLGVVGVTAEVQDLHGDLAALAVHRVGDHAMVCGFFRGGQRGAAAPRPALGVGRDAASDDEPDAAAHALAVEGRHALEAALGLFQADVHRAHQEAVGQGGEAEVQGTEEVRVGGHRLARN